MTTKFFANDGKCFTNEQDCLNYENELKEKEEMENKIKEEKEARYNEVIAAYRKYDDLAKKYYEDYLKGNGSFFINDMISDLFGW